MDSRVTCQFYFFLIVSRAKVLLNCIVYTHDICIAGLLMWRLKDSFVELLFSFHLYMGSRWNSG